ncbi:EpsG family protein [Weissella confusa]|uniref:EpsG family protein n=1 Tax=Weissella confusa TaxID=1583 RepID=UPI000989A503|nr:EpsG family protein [Weissella confusa]SJX70299.1 Putative capsule biosynthesis protein [Weissella confusa]
MFFWFEILALLIVLALIEQFFNIKWLFVISALVMSLIAGLRFYVGYDFGNYAGYYYTLLMKSVPYYKFNDYGWIVLNRLLAWIGVPEFLFFSIVSFTTIIALAWYFRKYSIIPATMLLYYFARFYFSRDMGQIRQSLALALALFAIQFVVKKRFWPFFIIIIISTSIHIGAAFLLLIYPAYIILDKYPIEIKKVYLYGILVGVLFSIFVILVGPITAQYAGRFQTYLMTASWTGLLNPILYYQLAISSWGVWTFTKYRGEMSQQQFAELIMYTIGTIFLAVFAGFNVAGGRLSTTFVTLEGKLIFDYASKIFGEKKSALLVTVLAVLIFFVLLIMTGAIRYFSPYTFNISV